MTDPWFLVAIGTTTLLVVALAFLVRSRRHEQASRRQFETSAVTLLETRSALKKLISERIESVPEQERTILLDMIASLISRSDARIELLDEASHAVRASTTMVEDVRSRTRIVEKTSRFAGYAARLVEAQVSTEETRRVIEQARQRLIDFLSHVQSKEFDLHLADESLSQVERILADLEMESGRELQEALRSKSIASERAHVRRFKEAVERSKERSIAEERTWGRRS